MESRKYKASSLISHYSYTYFVSIAHINVRLWLYEARVYCLQNIGHVICYKSVSRGSWDNAMRKYQVNVLPYPEPVYTGWSSVHWNANGMPLVDQCTLGDHWLTQRILAGYTGTPLEKLSWSSPTLERHWRNLVETAPYWDATGETLTFATYTGTPLEGLWQPTHAPTHIVMHAE